MATRSTVGRSWVSRAWRGWPSRSAPLERRCGAIDKPPLASQKCQTMTSSPDASPDWPRTQQHPASNAKLQEQPINVIQDRQEARSALLFRDPFVVVQIMDLYFIVASNHFPFHFHHHHHQHFHLFFLPTFKNANRDISRL